MTNLPPDKLQHYLDIATLAGKAGGEKLLKHWGRLSRIEHKSFQGDLVTEADKESEQAVIALLEKQFPDHDILSEESGLKPKNSVFRWVIDPLDGTTNYAHQLPFSAVSIGLLYNNEPVLGVVYNPMQNELFQAAKGLGATLNGKKIQVSKISALKDSLLTSGFPYDRRENPDNNYGEFCYLTHQTQGVRRMGAASLDLAYVAAGRFEGYWERDIKPWDIAAGIVLVLEAGGFISDYMMRPIDVFADKILATNGHIHEELSSELLRVQKLPFKDLAAVLHKT